MSLNVPPYCPLTLGINKDGRKAGSLAYTLQRLSDGQFLNAKTLGWGPNPTLNLLKERGRDANGNTDPGSGSLRGSYVPADQLNLPDQDTLGQFVVLYHDRNRDNLVVGSALFQGGLRLRGSMRAAVTPTPTPTPRLGPQAVEPDWVVRPAAAPAPVPRPDPQEVEPGWFVRSGRWGPGVKIPVGLIPPEEVPEHAEPVGE